MDNKEDKAFHWNHRVYKYEDGSLGIHEAYFYDNEEPSSHTVDPIPVIGDDIEELRVTLERMLRALEKPILEYKK